MRWALVCALGLSACAGNRFVPLPKEAQVFRAVTSDGWGLSMVRYQARGKVIGPPVLLCHGVSANSRNMDLDDGHSMARYFAAHGRETWTMSLRATGDSDGVDVVKGRRVPTFDDYWQQDLPAAIALVRRESGASEVDYVGHSMGGMILYAYLSQHGTGVHAAATLGSPTRLDLGTSLQGWAAALGALVLDRNSMVPSAFGAHVGGPILSSYTDSPVERLLYNPENVTPETWAHLLAYGTADTSGAVGLFMAGLVTRGSLTSGDGSLDFRKGLATVTTPVLVVAGRLDRLAPTAAVRDGYDALGGPKEWLLISRANGALAEYGHMDLVIGERAPDEVWSRVLDFFTRHARQEQ